MRCCATNNPGVHHLNFNTVAERSEQRERSRRISDSFAPAKPVPVLWIGLPGGFYLFTELLTQDTIESLQIIVTVPVLLDLLLCHSRAWLPREESRSLPTSSSGIRDSSRAPDTRAGMTEKFDLADVPVTILCKTQ